MVQVLLIEQNSDLSKVIKLNLMKTYDIEIVEKNNVSDGIEVIDILPSLDLIILRDFEQDKFAVDEIFKFLKSKEMEVPTIVVGRRTFQYQKEILIDPNSSWKVMIDIVGKTLKLDSLSDVVPNYSDYVPIPTEYFLNITETSIGCDVFIRLRKNVNDYQYIKRLDSKDNFTREVIERYMKSGLKEFYIPKEHFPRFVNYATDKILEKLGSDTFEVTEKQQLLSETYVITRDRIQSLGIDERTVELVDESIKGMQTTLNQNNALASFLKNLKSNSLSFSYSHSYLTCLLLQQIVKEFDWESNSVREKITYISYFHDISLADDILTKISSKEELDNSDLKKSQKELVIHHALKSSEILEQFPSVPIGVSALVREHHGVKTGIGFRQGTSISISPLSMMFVVVEEFVSEYLKYPKNPSKEDFEKIFQKLEVDFTKATYTQTLAILKKSILSK